MSGRAASILLAAALVVTLALLAWSRVQLGSRIRTLEDQARVLRGEIAVRDQVIQAQQGRLSAVRDRVEELRALLDRPLPAAP